MNELTVRDARRRLGLTQAQLAELTCLDQTTISDLETGRNTNPRLDTINKLAKALEIAPSKLNFNDPGSHGNLPVRRDKAGHTRRRKVVA